MKDTVTISFDIGGLLRFLSHQETATMMARALARAGTPVAYSEGFNPRPRMSLPLPRSVGLAACGEYLSFNVDSDLHLDLEALRDSLQSCLPEGLALTGIERHPGRVSLSPEEADYVFTLAEGLPESVRQNVARLAGSEPCPIERQDYKKGTARTVDARDYILAAKAEGNEISIRCRITPAGTLRVDELMRLLQIDVAMLKGGPLRREVAWHRRR